MLDNVKDPAKEIVTAARENLRTTDHSPFTIHAFTLLQDTVDDFIGDLMDEAIRIMKRHKAEMVQTKDVEDARSYLISSRQRKRYQHMGTIGGILLGAALSTILAMVQADSSVSLKAMGLTVSLAIIGTALVAIHIAKY